MESLKGSFLIASPGLSDPNFARSVVFMVEHNDEGAFGLILSRPVGVPAKELVEQIFPDGVEEGARSLVDGLRIYQGGPVQTGAVFFLHTLAELGSESVEPGVFLGSEREQLETILMHASDPDSAPSMRLFVGYAGWSSGQLEGEIRSGGWLVRPAKLDEVFSKKPEGLWGEIIKEFGGDLGILGMMPPEPELN